MHVTYMRNMRNEPTPMECKTHTCMWFLYFVPFVATGNVTNCFSYLYRSLGLEMLLIAFHILYYLLWLEMLLIAFHILYRSLWLEMLLIAFHILYRSLWLEMLLIAFHIFLSHKSTIRNHIMYNICQLSSIVSRVRSVELLMVFVWTRLTNPMRFPLSYHIYLVKTNGKRC